MLLERLGALDAQATLGLHLTFSGIRDLTWDQVVASGLATVSRRAALHAIEHHIDRLADDHANARLLAEGLARLPGVAIDLAAVETNIVMVDLPCEAAPLVARAAERGLLFHAVAPRRIRLVTHLDVAADPCRRALEIFKDLLR